MEFISPVDYTHFPSLEAAISHFITAKSSSSEESRSQAVTYDFYTMENRPGP